MLLSHCRATLTTWVTPHTWADFTHATSCSRQREVAAIRPLNLLLSAFLNKFQTPSCCEGVCGSLFFSQTKWRSGGARLKDERRKQTRWEKQISILPEANSARRCFSSNDGKVFISTVTVCLLRVWDYIIYVIWKQRRFVFYSSLHKIAAKLDFQCSGPFLIDFSISLRSTRN